MYPSPIVTGANVYRSQAQVTAAQIANLDSTPVLLVPAMPGKTLAASLIIDRYVFGTTEYVLNSLATAQLCFNGNPNLTASGGNDILADLINGQTASQVEVLLGSGGPYASALCLSQGLFLTAITGGFSGGPVRTIALDPGEGGSGYAPGDTGTIAQPGSSMTAAYEVDTVDGSGAVLTLHLTAGGEKYIAANAVPTGVTTGGGDGLLLVNITITPTPTGDGIVEFDILYQPF